MDVAAGHFDDEIVSINAGQLTAQEGLQPGLTVSVAVGMALPI